MRCEALTLASHPNPVTQDLAPEASTQTQDMAPVPSAPTWLAELCANLQGMEEPLAKAWKWCEETGIDSLEELREAEMMPGLLEAMDMKAGRAVIVQKRLLAAMGGE